MNARHFPPTAVLRPAARTQQLKGVLTSEIVKLTQRPDVISLAGAMPHPDSFPVGSLREAFDEVLRLNGRATLQCTSAEGVVQLREWIAASESATGVPTCADEVLIVAGAQQALDLIGKAFVEPNTPLLVEAPTYLGALQAFSLYGARCRNLPMDAEGLQPELIDARLAHDVRLLYTLPNFQNPSGRTLSAQRRQALAQVARRFDFWLVEDDLYADLWYDEPPPPSLREYAAERTIRVRSLSKVIAPGLRLGYIVAPRDCIELLVKIKQATDLHTSTVLQHAMFEVLSTGLLKRHLPSVCARYAVQCQVMLQALRCYMPQGVQWTQPEGGLFTWLTLPTHIDAMALLLQALAHKVAFVPGAPFFAHDPQHNTLRLSFSTANSEQIDRAVRLIAQLVHHVDQTCAN